MEAFDHTCTSKPLAWPSGKPWVLAGVVGSGNMEVLFESTPGSPDTVAYHVKTSIPGYRESWIAALDDFARHYEVGGTTVTIHDQGAPPVVVLMRLRQALDHVKS